MHASRLSRVFLFTALAAAALAVDARAGLIAQVSATVTQSGGVYTYDYTLSNDAGSTVGASSFFLTVGTDADLFGITTPTGWDVFYVSGAPTIEFASSSLATDVAPGFTGMFSLQSLIGPAISSLLLRGFDETTGEVFDVPGSALSPAAVPEPSTVILAAIGAVGLALARRRFLSPR